MKQNSTKVLVIDFGSQYSQLIARRVREAGIYCELMAYDSPTQQIADFNPKGIILSGGPESVNQQQAPKIPEVVFELNCPILGICYGMQALVQQLGGKVEFAEKREFGHADLNVVEQHVLFKAAGISDSKKLDVWMSHGDHVVSMPEGFDKIAYTNNAPIAAIANDKLHYYGLQFHPEVTHTAEGKSIINQFLYEICNLSPNWNASNFIEQAVADIKSTVKNEEVLLGLSGGVDSSVLAALLHKAIGDQLTCVFVDNGLLRLNEVNEVLTTFQHALGINLVHIDAKDIFLEALHGIECPEQKRKIIGNTFIDVFDAQALKLKNVTYLAQGTIYPDVIESAGTNNSKAHVIKSHHNVGGLPENMRLKLCEPLRMLFKDEVRKVGTALGLPDDIIQRHPFPGPGLGVRVLGEVKQEYVKKLQYADAIFIEELKNCDFYNKVSQAFAVFLPVKSVGVVGDTRAYEHVIALRAVETTDFMTATWASLPHDFLAKVANRIINEVNGIARVVYDISSKPPATIEWE